jgi:hypothetical protein
MILAAMLVMRVRDVGDNGPESEVVEAHGGELLTVPEAVQPVPSTGLNS